MSSLARQLGRMTEADTLTEFQKKLAGLPEPPSLDELRGIDGVGISSSATTGTTRGQPLPKEFYYSLLYIQFLACAATALPFVFEAEALHLVYVMNDLITSKVLILTSIMLESCYIELCASFLLMCVRRAEPHVRRG